MKHPNIRIPNRLRKYRKVRGLTQLQAANILGYTNGSRLSKWEHGACLPDTRNLFRLAAVYRTLVDALYIDVVRDVRQEVREREDKIMKRHNHDSQTCST